MFVFITHPRYFDKQDLCRKRIDLIYIFNSKKLYDELSKRYKCVNLGIDGKIKNENFFKSEKVDKYKLFEDLKSVYSYVLKIRQSRDIVMDKSLKKYTLKFINEMANINIEYGISSLKDEIFSEINRCLDLSFSKTYLEKNKKYFDLILKYGESFFIAFISSFGIKNNYFFNFYAEIIAYAINSFTFYTPNSFDIYKDKFRYEYLKVLSRLFIEAIHKKEIKQKALYIKEIAYDSNNL